MTPELEAAVLKESEAALRELVTAFHNVGLSKGVIAFMLRQVAEETQETIVVPNENVH